MKKIAAVAILALTSLSAFAAPFNRTAVPAGNFHRTVVVAHRNGRKAGRRPIRKTMLRKHVR